MHTPHRTLGPPFWEPGTRVHITHDRDRGTVVSDTTDAMTPTLTAHGLVPDGHRRWRLPNSVHRPVDLDAIDALVDALRHHHHAAVSTRLTTGAARR